MRLVHNTKIVRKRDRNKFLIGFDINKNISNCCVTCVVCGRLMQKYALNDHVQNHSEIKYKCIAENCGWKYRESEYWNFREHSKTKHGVDIRAYPKSVYRIDGETEGNGEANSNSLHGIDADIEWHSEVFRTCPICSRILNGQDSLESHVGMHEHLNERCEENGCGWAFLNFTLLRKHYLVHHKLLVTKDNKDTIYILNNSMSSDKRQCPICKRIFPHKFDHDHVRHHDKLKFQCLEPNCGWIFKYFHTFRSHYSNHHKLELSCDAEQTYLTRGQIVLKTQSDGYGECPTCSRRMREGFLASHQAVHQQKSMYRCPKSGCSWMYENRETFRSHCDRVHKMRIENRVCQRFLVFKPKNTQGRSKRFGLTNSSFTTLKSIPTTTKQLCQKAKHNNVDLPEKTAGTGTELLIRPSVRTASTQPHPDFENISESFQETLVDERKEIVNAVERAINDTHELENTEIKIEKNEPAEENVSEAEYVMSVKKLSQQPMSCAQQDFSEIERLLLVDTTDRYCNNYAYNENQGKLSSTSTTGLAMNEFTCTPGTINDVQDSNVVNNCAIPDQCKEMNTPITPPITNDLSWSTETMPIVIMPEEDQPAFSQVTVSRTSDDVLRHNSGQNPSQQNSRLSVQDTDLVSSQNTIGTSLQFPEEGKKSL